MLKLGITDYEGELSESDVYYVPLFPGIFIDLNRSIQIEDCQVLKNQYDVGSEFYFHKDKLSKIFIEFPLFTQFELLPKYLMNDMLEIVKKNSSESTIVINSYQKEKNDIPQATNIHFTNESDQIFIFFNEIATFNENLVENDDLQFAKLCNDCFLALNVSTQSIYFLCIENYQNKYWFQDFSFSELELGVNRTNSLRKIIRNSFDLDFPLDQFKRNIENHIVRFESDKVLPEIESAERKMLENVMNDFLHNKNLNKR